MDKRKVTKREEEIYRLCHHDFEGLTTIRAAERLGISQGQVQRTLRNLKAKAPPLFPILTAQQVCVRNCINEFGCTHAQTAKLQNVTEGTIDTIVATMKAKGVCFEPPRKTVRYAEHQDSDVKQKF